MRSRFMLIAAVLALGQAPVHAQEGAKPTGEPPSAPDQGQVDHSKMGHGAPPPAAPAPNMSGGMDHGSMQGGTPPPDARDPHAYSEGYGFGPMRPKMGDEDRFGSFLADRFERVRTRDSYATVYDVLAWYGGVYDRAWFKTDGEREAGGTSDARTELLWGHAVAAFWDTQLGVRYDSGTGPNRSWLAFGVQGLAPYWFNLEATAYLGEEGRSALRLEAEYELLFTQRLVLQPHFETNIYGKSDAARGVGSGLSNADVGLRLRYEIRREFAPYIGIERVRKFGDTADLARAAGNDTGETLYVAGVRFWF